MVMPQDEGPVSFGYELTRAIGDVREALRNRNDASWELGILQGLLQPWADEDPEFLRRMRELEKDIIRMKQVNGWPRDQKPSWQIRNLGYLIWLAKENKLLDVSERYRPPRGKELIEPTL